MRTSTNNLAEALEEVAADRQTGQRRRRTTCVHERWPISGSFHSISSWLENQQLCQSAA